MIDHVGKALDEHDSQDALDVVCLADVRPRPIEWLWQNWVAIGKVSVLAGDGGQGKSTILCDLAGRTTTGERWPDGAEASRPGSVVMLAAEDDVEDTLAPRLLAVGADTKKIFTIRSVRTGKTRRTFSLQTDIARLEAEITRLGDVRLVIIDPISSYLGKVDSHKNAEVRSVLEPLGELAPRLRIAIVCNNHFSKGGGNANSRIIGSVAFVNQARAAFIVTPDAENEGRYLLMPSKMNIAPIKHGLAYRVEGCQVQGDDNREILTSRVSWETEPVTITADQALAAHAEDGGNRSALTEAMEFLRDQLDAGPLAAKEAEEHARALMIAPATLKRARKKLGVVATKAGLKEGWIWKLPEGDQKTPKGITSETWSSSAQVDPLRERRPTSARPPASTSPAPQPSIEMPDLPPFLDRRPKNGGLGPPALGPPGDSLDDFR